MLGIAAKGSDQNASATRFLEKHAREASPAQQQASSLWDGATSPRAARPQRCRSYIATIPSLRSIVIGEGYIERRHSLHLKPLLHKPNLNGEKLIGEIPFLPTDIPVATRRHGKIDA